MNEEPTPKRWREALAAVGVMLSLVFVGLELRQNTAAISATALNDLTEGSNAWMFQITSDGEMADIYVRWRDGLGELSPDEEIRIRLLIFALLRNSENAFLQTGLGVVDTLALRGYGFSGAPPFQSPSFPPLWADFKSRFHPDFVTAFDASYGL